MRSKKLIKIFSASLFRYLLTLFFSFFTRKLFIDALGVEYLGVSGLMANVLGVLAIAELGIGSSIVFSLYKPLAENDQNKVHILVDLYRTLYRYIALCVLVLGLVIMPFLTVISPDLAHIPYYNVIYLMFLANSVIPYFFAYNSTLYTATQQDYILQNIRTLFYVFTTGATIVVLLWFPDYILLTACTMLLGILSQLVIYYMAHRKWTWLKNKSEGKLEAEDISIIKKNVRAMVFHKIGDYCINGSSSLIIAYAINLATVGLMANYMVIVGVLRSIAQEFFDSMIAGTGELVATTSSDKILHVFREMTYLAYVIYGLLCLGIYFCVDDVICLWLGDGFLLPKTAILFIALNLYFLGMRVPPRIIKSGAGLFSNDQFAPIFESVINLVVGIWLAQTYGIAGVTAAILISGFCVPSWYRPYVVYRDLFHYSFLQYIYIFAVYLSLLSMSFFFLEYVFEQYLPASHVARLGYKIMIILLEHMTIVVLYAIFSAEGKSLCARVLTMFKRIS